MLESAAPEPPAEGDLVPPMPPTEPLSLESLDRPVGSGFEYSNANYVVLGMVIQAVSGQSYEAYVQEHIYNPLEMNNSFTSQVEAQQHGMSGGYQRWFGFPVASGSLPYPRGMVPGGYLISSAEDLGHYMIAQMNQGSYAGASILSPEGIEVLHAPAVAAAPEGFPGVSRAGRAGARRCGAGYRAGPRR